MAAIKTSPMASTEQSPVRYHIVNPQNNHVQLSQRGAFLVVSDGGNTIVLTQQNASDLATAFSNFGSSGTLS